MKVLFLLYMGFEENGPSVHLLKSIIGECLSRGNNVTLIIRSFYGETIVIPNEFKKYKNFSYEVVTSKKQNKSNLIARYIEDIKYSFSCKKKYLDKEFDVAFIQSNVTMFISVNLIKKYLHIPIVYNAQDLFPQDLLFVKEWHQNNCIYKALLAIQKMAYSNVDKIITISLDMKQTLMEMGVDQNKIEVVYNWSYSDEAIDINPKDNTFSRTFNINGQNIVLYAGNLGKKQNTDIIVESAKKLKDEKAKFVMVGNKRNNDEYGYIKEENVLYCPLQKQEMAESVYSAADIIIIPLKKGMIKTALPSKIATCLRLKDKRIIFCIERSSLFYEQLKKFDNVKFCEPENVEELTNTIKKMIQDDSDIRSSAYSFFRDNMSAISNPKRYCEIIEAEGIK